MKNYFIILSLIISLNAWTRPRVVGPIVSNPIVEAWVKLTCHGVVTPRFAYPTIERQIMTAHLKISPSQKYPHMEDLIASNSDFFKKLTKTCTERRRAKVEFGSFTGQWLDWGTDWGFSRLTLGEEVLTLSEANKCRAVGKPCSQNSQCCGSTQRLSYCNINANTCESNAISSGGSSNALSPL
jgi:hypothetical protein